MNKSSGREMGSLVTVLIYIGMIDGAKGNPLVLAGRAAWMVPLLIGGVMVAYFLIMRRFADKNKFGLIEAGSVGIGRPALALLGIILLLMSGRTMRSLVIASEMYALPSVRGIYIGIVSAALICMAAITGIGAICRTARIALPAMLAIILLVYICEFRYPYPFSNIFPIFGNGFDITVKSAMSESAAFIGILIPFMESGAIKGKRGLRSLTGMVIAVILLTVGYFESAVVYPDNMIKTMNWPIHELATAADIGRYVQRLRAPFEFMWMIGSLLACSALLYYSALCFSTSFGTGEHKRFIPVLAVVMLTLGVYPPEATRPWLNTLLEARTPIFTLFFLPPAILVLLGVLRKKREGALDA